MDAPFGFGPDSKVLRAQHAQFLQLTVEQVLSEDREKGVFAILKPLRLPAALYSEMVGELVALVDKYGYLSEHVSQRDAPDREAWSLAIAAGPGRPAEPAPLK